MNPKRITSWEELEALPEGKWVAIAGVDADVADDTGVRRPARITIPLSPEVAQRLSPRAGEVLQARVKGRSVELVRRPAKRRRSLRS